MCIESIGICDLNQKAVARWTAEMGQVSWPWDYDALPEVEPVAPEQLCSAATCSSSPPPRACRRWAATSGTCGWPSSSANRPLVEHFARQAREAGFRGLFAVLSRPGGPAVQGGVSGLQPGARTAGGTAGACWPEQIQGFGLGVMNARAAYFAKQDPRFAAF